jgi:hypothetical protein
MLTVSVIDKLFYFRASDACIMREDSAVSGHVFVCLFVCLFGCLFV